MSPSIFKAAAAVPSLPGSEPAPIADRLPAFDGLSIDAPKALRNLTVTIIGVGSVGGACAEHWARLGVGTLLFIDPGKYKSQSILTHPGVMPRDVGKHKAIVAGDRCKQITLRTRVLTCTGGIEDVPPAELAQTDIVMLATDNLAAEVAAGRVCASLGKPLIQMSVDGATLLAQVRIFMNRGDGPCPRCLYGADEEELLRSGQRFSCDGSSKWLAQPTVSVSALCAMAASMGAMLALRHVLHLGKPLEDSLHEFCGYTSRACVSSAHRRWDCPENHARWTILHSDRPVSEQTPAQLAGLCQTDLHRLSLEFDGVHFAENGICADGHLVMLRHFVNGDGQSPWCPKCSAAVRIPRVSLRERIPGDLLRGSAQRPLSQILPSAPRWAIARADERTWLILGPRNDKEAA